jgi:nucleotide-binding universal stress UspA family protein
MYNKFLVPTDGSSISTAAARVGVQFAKECGADVTGIYVVPNYVYPIYAESVLPDYRTEHEYKAAMLKAAEIYLGEIKKACSATGVKYSESIGFSDYTAQQIVDIAKEKGCDLIFIGSHGRSGWGQLLLGSVTSKVLSMCDIPVLVYRLTKEPMRYWSAS